jgi:hypothetical protein
VSRRKYLTCRADDGVFSLIIRKVIVNKRITMMRDMTAFRFKTYVALTEVLIGNKSVDFLFLSCGEIFFREVTGIYNNAFVFYIVIVFTDTFMVYYVYRFSRKLGDSPPPLPNIINLRKNE